MEDPLSSQAPILQRFSLRGRVALVTGGGQGIGRAFAHALGEAGASVAVVDMVKERADVVKNELLAKGIESIAIVANVTKASEVEAMVQTVVQWKGELHVAVNNAGIVTHNNAEDMTEREWDSVLDVNLKGVFLCCQAEARAMLPKGYGKIVNVASMSARIVNHPQNQCSYNASKAGVVHLTKSLATEWAPKGLCVNSISPGYIATPLNYGNPQLVPLISEWTKQTPLRRLGSVTDLQGAVVFMASDTSDFMTGHDLVIDGGFTCW